MSEDGGRLRFYASVVAIAVALLAFIIGKLWDILPLKDISWAIALVFVCMVVTALLCRANMDSLAGSISTMVADEIKKVVNERLLSHVQTIETLNGEAHRAAVHLRAGNPDSDLRKVLLTERDIREYEGKATEKIYVVTRDLSFDERIAPTVISNVKRGVVYYYFFPEDVISTDEIKSFILRLDLDPETMRRLKFISVPKEEYNFPADLVVYSPQKDDRKGYIRLPLEDPLGGIRAILLRGGDPLHDFKELLDTLLKRHPEIEFGQGVRGPQWK
jgi:hypothetical protein